MESTSALTAIFFWVSTLNKLGCKRNGETVNENFIDIELGGWNIPETIVTEPQPVDVTDYSVFEL